MQNKTLTERQRYWLEHIKSWDESGLRMSEYARTQEFPVQALYEAKKALVKKGVLPRARGSYPTHFERVQIIEPSVETKWRIALPNGSVVEFSGSPDEPTLSTVLKAIATAQA